jgi:hypothetical protein
MEEDDIERLFLSVAEGSENRTTAVRNVFAALVKSTLEYRDSMLASKGVIVTVKDVRITLECLVPFLETGRLPDAIDHIKLDLLKIWKDRLSRIA